MLLAVFGLFVVITPVLPSGEITEVNVSQFNEEVQIASVVEEMYGDAEARVMKEYGGSTRTVTVTVRGGLLDRVGLTESETPPEERAQRIVDSLRVRYPAFQHVDSLSIRFEDDIGFIKSSYIETYSAKDL